MKYKGVAYELATVLVNEINRIAHRMENGDDDPSLGVSLDDFKAQTENLGYEVRYICGEYCI